MADPTTDWLLDGDPAVVWQTQRDLLDLPSSQWEQNRRLISTEGWGRALLDRQDESGTWGGGLYNPKWTSTTYTLLLLRRFGLAQDSPQAVAGLRRLLDDADWVEGGVSYWSSRPLAERCVNGMVLSIASWFDIDDGRIDDIAGLLLGSRLTDGGWNCGDRQGRSRIRRHAPEGDDDPRAGGQPGDGRNQARPGQEGCCQGRDDAPGLPRYR